MIYLNSFTCLTSSLSAFFWIIFFSHSIFFLNYFGSGTLFFQGYPRNASLPCTSLNQMESFLSSWVSSVELRFHPLSPRPHALLLSHVLSSPYYTSTPQNTCFMRSMTTKFTLSFSHSILSQIIHLGSCPFSLKTSSRIFFKENAHLFHFLKTASLRYNTHLKQFTHFKVYNSMAFKIFTDLCNHHKPF